MLEKRLSKNWTLVVMTTGACPVLAACGCPADGLILVFVARRLGQTMVFQEIEGFSRDAETASRITRTF